METVIRKLSSRKLWAMVAGVVTGLSLVFGLDGEIITAVSGAVVSLASVITYIITEGKIDAEAVKKTVEDIQKAEEEINNTVVL